MSTNASHICISAPYRRDRELVWKSLELPQASYAVDCHRLLRGPYTGTGSLLRQLVPTIYANYSEHVLAHNIEILSLAPELKTLLAVSTETLTSLAVPEERTRFYSRMRTLRITHGLIDFLKGCIALGAFERIALFFNTMQAADDLDQEFVRELLRRADPTTIQVVIGAGMESLPEKLATAVAVYAQPLQSAPLDEESHAQRLQSWQLPSSWQDWLLAHSQGYAGEGEPLKEVVELLTACPPSGDTFAAGMENLVQNAPAEQRATWARAFIASDCTSDSLLESLAYRSLDDTTRRAWHDERAQELELLDDWSLRLGAIPYHHEHGTSPADKGAQALQKALDYCINMGFYEATVDLGYRGRAVIDWQTQLQYFWTFTTKNTTSLAALERPDEAEKLYNEARATTVEPSIHMQAAYATSMLYTRHYSDDQRDHIKAKGWINEAIAIARLLPDPKDRAFNVVFNRNGLALIETHLRHPQEALRLVTEGLEILDRTLEPGEHLLHRSVLRYNRAQVYAGLGELEKALADYTAVIAEDPHYSEYYFDRGNILRRLQRNEDALADYEKAIRYSPPYPEAYYNRAGVLSVLGREDEALADYTYVLEIDPTNLDALVNRASMLYERGLFDEARADVNNGLQLSPGNAQLLCTLGLIEMAEEHPTASYEALSAAIEQDPSLIAAWTNRAILSFELERQDAAIEDFTHALALEANATVFYNRGIAHQSQGNWHEAIADFSQALALSDEDAPDIFYRLGLCYKELGNEELARQNFQAYAASNSSEGAEHLESLLYSQVSEGD